MFSLTRFLESLGSFPEYFEEYLENEEEIEVSDEY